MDKLILNGGKIRVFNQGNSQSGSIQYTQNGLKIVGQTAGNGLLISDGKLHLKNGSQTTSITYTPSQRSGITLEDGRLNLRQGNYWSNIQFTQSILKFTTPSAYELLRIGSSATGQYMSFFIGDQSPTAGYGGTGRGSLFFDGYDALYTKYGDGEDAWGRIIRTDNSDNILISGGSMSIVSGLTLPSLSDSQGNFLTINDGVVSYRTPAEVISDIGSTSDADTLDGTHSSGFLRNALTVDRGYVNTCSITPGFYRIQNQSMTGLPGYFHYIQHFGQYSSGNYSVQLATQFDAAQTIPSLWIRRAQNGNASWTQWWQLLGSGRVWSSSVQQGTSPISMSSTTVCPNLNADLLDGTHSSGFAPNSIVRNNMQFVYTMYTQSVNASTFTITPDMLTGSLGLTTATEVYLHVNVSSYISLNGNTFFSQDYPALILQPQLGKPLIFESLEITPAASPPFTASLAVMFQVKQ